MQLPITSIGDKAAVVGQVRWQSASQRLVDERGHLEVDALVASVDDGALAIYGRSIEYRLPAGSSVLCVC